MLPKPLDGSHFSEGWREYEDKEEREGWYRGDGYEDMHLQGRRWAGNIKEKINVAKGTEYKGSIYDAGPTFESYGVPHGSSGTFCMETLFFFFFDWVLGNVVCLICLALGYLMRSGFVVFCLLWFFDLVLGCLG